MASVREQTIKSWRMRIKEAHGEIRSCEARIAELQSDIQQCHDLIIKNGGEVDE